MSCEVIESSHMLGKKWSIPLIEEVAHREIYSFNRLVKKAHGATPRIISMQLKELEKSGIIKKEFRAQDNRKFAAYSLTKKGTELQRVINGMKAWNVKWNRVPEFCLNTPCLECPKHVT